MRTTHQESGMLVQAVAGTHVVLLGWDLMDPQRRKGLLGFAIQREDQTEGESYWLRGMKTFASCAPLAPDGNPFAGIGRTAGTGCRNSSRPRPGWPHAAFQ